ncbi:CHAT domain-containing protein [Pantanalinema sp. GBBB05]|uniref:CHAT domain-containing protein n=1 Tax=Pantanalinema sp. GBBB05 TaxID=2604139 RepID=UPI001DAC3CF8|nr:tetratricopeptide repeat protein [Pantanalinema sp. GBBB05]
MCPVLKFANVATAILLAITAPLVPLPAFNLSIWAQTYTDRQVEADQQLEQGQQLAPEAGLPLLQQALRIYQEIQYRPGEGQAFKALGNAVYQLKQYAQAIAYYQQALTIARQIKDGDLEGRSLNNLGNGYQALGNTSKAIECYQTSLALAQASSNLELLPIVVNNLGQAYREVGEKGKEIELYQQTLRVLQDRGDRAGQALILNNLGSAYTTYDQYHQAIQLHQQAFAIFQETGDRAGQAKALIGLGYAYYWLSQQTKAIPIFQQAFTLFKQMNNRAGQAIALNRLGNAYHYLGQYNQAVELHRQALSLFQQLGNQAGEASTLFDLGNAYSFLGQPLQALELHQQALSRFQQLGDRRNQASAISNIASYYSRNQPDKAIALYQEALALFRQGNNRYGEAQALKSLGNLYLGLKQVEQAINLYQQALPIFSAIDEVYGQAYTLQGLGSAYVLLQQYDQSLKFYQQALTILKRIGDREGESGIWHNIGSLLVRQHQPELAIIVYKQSVNVYETIRADLRKLPRQLQESYTQSVSGSYRTLANLLIEQGRIGEAQQVLERLKVQELNDFTQGSRAPTAIAEVGFNSLETQIQGQYNSLIAFGGKFYDCEQRRCAQYSELKTQYQTLSKEFQTFVEQIKQQLHDSRLAQVDQSTQDFQTSADRVVTANPNSILIYPLVLADKTRILWAAKGGVLSKTAVCPLGEAALYSKVSQFQALLSTHDDEAQLQAIGKDLYDCLVKPLEPELAANKIQHLIFVPDRATNYIPMAALFDGNHYLIQRFAVSNILSASLTDTGKTLLLPPSTSVLALGLSEAQGDYSALPNVEAELNAIVKQPNNRGIYPGEILLNQQFTKAAFEDNIWGHKIIHIATHSEFKSENPRSSYFLLGTGTPYPIPDVQTLRDLKDVQLVVLSACQTGLGGTDGLGLEVSGISSFFMGDRDRAKAVLASLWSVSDASTSVLMQQFYKYLATGKLTKAEALRQAQLSLLNGTLPTSVLPYRTAVPVSSSGQAIGSLAHPYYWSPFILIGNSL